METQLTQGKREAHRRREGWHTFLILLRGDESLVGDVECGEHGIDVFLAKQRDLKRAAQRDGRSHNLRYSLEGRMLERRESFVLCRLATALTGLPVAFSCAMR